MSEKSQNRILPICLCVCAIVCCLFILQNKLTSTKLSNESQISETQVETLTEHEVQHVKVLEEGLDSFIEHYVQLMQANNNVVLQLQMQNIIITGQGSYIVQLIEVLEANNINIPAPNMKDRGPTPADPQDDKDWYPINLTLEDA